ncbi:MAG TPA: AI-2E family transporter [Thermomicrobiales bacterium]|nr:AI-2E family transporter [Thermomicrobiales bacterium]
MHPIDRLRETRLLPVFVLLGAVASVWFLYEVSGILAPFLWALVTAYVLFPVVRFLERKLKLPRILVVSGLYVVFVGVLVLLGIYLAPVAVDQGEDLLATLPQTVDDARTELLEDPTVRIGSVEIDAVHINDRIDRAIEDVVDELSARAVPLVIHTVEIAIHVLVYFLVTFYFLLHGDEILRQARSLTPRRHRGTIDRVGRQVNATLGAYIRGQVILFALMSVATYIALTIYDVDYALALAIATGALELIPIIGPWTAGAAAVTVAVSQGHAPFGWSQVELGVAVALTYFVLRMLEDHFVIPQLIGRIVRVHPVLVIFAILAGASSFGILGLLLAVPTLATLKIVAQAIYYELGNPPARVVVPVQQAEDLETVRSMLGDGIEGQLVMLLGEGAIGWDELGTMQELALVAVSNDVSLKVVTPDRFAASIATAAGLRVVTEARMSDEVGTVEALLARGANGSRKRRFAFDREPAGLELPGEPSAPAQQSD